MGGGSIWLRHPVPKFNREAVERSAPVVNRHRPLFGDPLQGHVIELEDRFLMGKHPAILADLPQGPVDRFNGVGRVDGFADLGRILQERDELRPVCAPALANGGIFTVPLTL